MNSATAATLRAPRISWVHWCSCNASLTIRRFCRRFGTRGKCEGLGQQRRAVEPKLSVQNRVIFPSPTIVFTAAAKRALTGSCTWIGKAAHGLSSWVLSNYNHLIRSSQHKDFRSWFPRCDVNPQISTQINLDWSTCLRRTATSTQSPQRLDTQIDQGILHVNKCPTTWVEWHVLTNAAAAKSKLEFRNFTCEQLPHNPHHENWSS